VCYCTSGWSLAAAETGRMIDVRSASAKARAVPLSSCAGGSQSQTQSRSSLRFDNMVHAVPYFLPDADLPCCRLLLLRYRSQQDTTALRHGNLPPVRPEHISL
jgi:hypothetical protein